MKEPWFNLEVDYDFFTFKTFRQQYLPWLRWLAVLGFAVPVSWIFIDREIRLWEQKRTFFFYPFLEIKAQAGQTQTTQKQH